MKVSLLLATFGRAEELHPLMQSLRRQTFRDFEVIVIDQNDDDRVARILAQYAGDFPLQHIRSAPGHSRAFNVGLANVTGDLIAFPDDDCWYDPDVLERVVSFLRSNPSWDGLTGREWIEPGFSSGFRWDANPGPITTSNVWRRAITFSMFLRSSVAEGLWFDESLGVGAGSPWGAGEETDYLIRALSRGSSIYYDPSLGVWHRGRSGPYTAEIYAKASYYGQGIGRVLRKHQSPAHCVATHMLRPLGGAALSLGWGRPEKARYHWSIFQGRLGGWSATPEHPDGGAEPPMRSLQERMLQSPLVQNAAALYGVQISRKIVPLIIVPYLARTLGPAGWGMVAFAQSLGEFIVLLIEFGFNLSATRAIARNRHSREKCGEIVAGVVGAQLLLAVAAVSAAVIVSRGIPSLRDNPKLLAAGLFYAVAQGFMPLWFFQGLERLRLAAGLEITGKLLGMGAILLFVHRPEDGWVALFVQGMAPALATATGITLAYRAIPFRRPTCALVSDAVRRGWRMFVFRSGESLYGVGNAFLLGLFAPPTLVGYFASAEKVSRAAFGLLNPIRETLYPRISHIISESPARAARLARVGAAISICGGILLGLLLLVFAPWLIAVVMGPGFAEAVPVLRVLSVLPPLLAITHSVGLQWLLPSGRDAEVNRIILSAGALNLILAILLAPHFAHVGMAWAVVCAETLVCCWMVRAVVSAGPTRVQHPILLSISSN